MEDINSESRFVWKLILDILLTPITLILVLIGKKEFKELFRPFSDIVKFMFEPKFTITMIIINVAIFFLSFFLGDALLNSFVNYPSDMLGLRAYTLITAGFLHASMIHLFGNMLGIFIFGRVVERKLGFGKTFLIYFGALVVSGLFSSLIHLFIIGDDIAGIGASGALMGLVATAILIDPFYITYELLIPMPVMVVGWLTLYADIAGVLNPIEDGIGHFAHIGGFISVGLSMFLLGIEERSKLRRGLIINIVLLVIASLMYFLLLKKPAISFYM